MSAKNRSSPSKLPVFFNLEGKTCLLAGDAPAIAAKLRLLVVTGAQIRLRVPAPDTALLQQIDSPPLKDQVEFRPEAWSEADFYTIFLAIGAFDDPEQAHDFARTAREASVPVNLVDRPPLCDFQVPSLIDRSPLLIGISTGGTAPAIGQWLRGHIETLLPTGLEKLLYAARDVRGEVAETLPSPKERRAYWRRVTGHLDDLAAAEPSDIKHRLRGWLHAMAKALPPAGRLSLIMVPENIEQLTLGALRRLQQADLVQGPPLLLERVIMLARRDCERDTGPVDPRTVLAAARQGQVVVLMPGTVESGRPSPHAALQSACESAGIAFEHIRPAS
jgi:uroporphyrin-III C-methyltransferase/precorrin-2 dehydrogenase/sirohydrochlorin ferrochelatase